MKTQKQKSTRPKMAVSLRHGLGAVLYFTSLLLGYYLCLVLVVYYNVLYNTNNHNLYNANNHHTLLTGQVHLLISRDYKTIRQFLYFYKNQTLNRIGICRKKLEIFSLQNLFQTPFI